MGEQKNLRSGFTRAELLVVLGCVCFLGLVWLRPSLATSAARNDEAVCANNLRLIGQAFLQWSQEHADVNAWWIDRGRGGTKGIIPEYYNLWFHFFWVSNELRSPRFLVDPADDWVNVRVATSWGDAPGGLVNPGWRNNAVSYFLGLHATPLQPQSILSGDGSIYSPDTSGCSTGIPRVTAVRPQNTLWVGPWPENRHGNRGNLLFQDGRVELTDTARLKEALGWGDAWNRHILKARP